MPFSGRGGGGPAGVLRPGVSFPFRCVYVLSRQGGRARAPPPLPLPPAVGAAAARRAVPCGAAWLLMSLRRYRHCARRLQHPPREGTALADVVDLVGQSPGERRPCPALPPCTGTGVPSLPPPPAAKMCARRWRAFPAATACAEAAEALPWVEMATFFPRRRRLPAPEWPDWRGVHAVVLALSLLCLLPFPPASPRPPSPHPAHPWPTPWLRTHRLLPIVTAAAGESVC